MTIPRVFSSSLTFQLLESTRGVVMNECYSWGALLSRETSPQTHLLSVCVRVFRIWTEFGRRDSQNPRELHIAQ